MEEPDIIIFQCSPRPYGINSRLLGILLEKSNLRKFIRINLYEYKYSGCTGCNNCYLPPHACIFDPDPATALLQKLTYIPFSIFFIPIYFYSIPSHFKAFVDRAQKYWAIDRLNSSLYSRKSAWLIFTAGRKNGSELFSGATRTMRFFLKLFNIEIAGVMNLRGMENLENIDKNTVSKLTDLSMQLRSALLLT